MVSDTALAGVVDRSVVVGDLADEADDEAVLDLLLVSIELGDIDLLRFKSTISGFPEKTTDTTRAVSSRLPRRFIGQAVLSSSLHESYA